MQKNVVIAAAVVGACFIAIGVAAGIYRYNVAEVSNTRDDPRTVNLAIFGSIPYWDQDAALDVFRAHPGTFDIISLFWYTLDEEGNIVKYEAAEEDLSIIEFAHQHNVKVLGLIANLPEEGEWDSQRVDRVIAEPEARAAHIDAIMRLVREKGFDGINIDYEFLNNAQTTDFSTFVFELAETLHAENKILAVAAHAQLARLEKRGQNLRALAAADIVALMAYDEHWETSEPGPIASVPWVREVLEYTRRKGVPMERVYLGVPLYGYDWAEEGDAWGAATGLEYEDVQRLLARTEAEVSFNTDSVSPHVSYEEDGEFHHVWFEDVDSFSAKYELAKEFGLGGIALWRLGREDKRIYDVIE